MVDYSKWDKLELLSDDDEECHPNIDKASFKRWKKQAKVAKLEAERQEEQEEREKLAQVTEVLKELDLKLKKLEQQVKQPGQSSSGEPEKEVTLDDLLRDQKEALKVQHQLKEKLAVRERNRKFTEEDACVEKFSKTIINPAKKSETIKVPTVPKSVEKKSETSAKKASTSTTTTTEIIHNPAKDAPAPVKETTGADPLEEKFGVKRPSEEEESEFRDQLNVYVQQMEQVAHTLNQKQTYEEMYNYIGEHSEIVCEESVSYLLLHCSDAIKKGNFKASKQFLKTSQVVKYCMELGKDGIYLFFMRMRDPSGRFKSVFESEVMAYWQRIKEKILELQAMKIEEKRKRYEELKKQGVEVPEKAEDLPSDEEEVVEEDDE